MAAAGALSGTRCLPFWSRPASSTPLRLPFPLLLPLLLLPACLPAPLPAVDEDHNGDVLLLRYLCSLLHQDLTARLAVAAAWADVGEEGVQRRRAALLRNSLLWRMWLDEVRACGAKDGQAACSELQIGCGCGVLLLCVGCSAPLMRGAPAPPPPSLHHTHSHSHSKRQTRPVMRWCGC